METLDIERAKEDAFNNAAKYVATSLQRPDQLDKVEQIRRRVLRNKASVDSRLKTAVQSQLDGINSGLSELKRATVEIKEIKNKMKEADNAFTEARSINEKMEDLRAAQIHYARLAKTNEHLKQIFNVPETVERTQNLIQSGHYLQAHKNIMELEATRDDILFEVHQLRSLSHETGEYFEHEPLNVYFAPVEKLSDQLSKQLWHVIAQTLSAARSNPTELVTALRIIEREERSDRRSKDHKEKTGFSPPGRPKLWKERCLAVIRKSVDNRFESNQMELIDRSDKMWLVRHLERMRAFILQDILTVKDLVRPCFPQSYKIFEEYLKMYHQATSRTLEELALGRNDPNECVSLLAWIKDYFGPDLMGHDKIVEDVGVLNEELGSLLSPAVVEAMNETYVKTTEKNMQSWLSKMVERENQDWVSNKLPETDVETYYQTSLPIILFQMLDQNLQVAAEINKDVRLKVIDICVASLTEFTLEYESAIKGFKDKHFQEKSVYFEPYMTAIINNCHSITEFGKQMKNQLKADLGPDDFGDIRIRNFDEVINAFQSLAEESCGYMLDGVFIDLEQYLADLMTRKWFKTNIAVDTIIMTVEDYSNDYRQLKPKYFDFIMKTAEERIIVEYVKAIMSRRIAFKSFEERKEGAEQMIDEAKKIALAFTRIANLPPLNETACAILPAIAEVLKLRDPSIVSLEISGVATMYPDFRAEHALALLALRGDMGRTESKQMVTDLKIRDSSEAGEDEAKGIFSQINVAATVLDKLEAKMGR